MRAPWRGRDRTHLSKRWKRRSSSSGQRCKKRRRPLPEKAPKASRIALEERPARDLREQLVSFDRLAAGGALQIIALASRLLEKIVVAARAMRHDACDFHLTRFVQDGVFHPHTLNDFSGLFLRGV